MHTPISYLAGNAGEIATTGISSERSSRCAGAGLDPRDSRAMTWSARLLARRGKDGSWAGQVNQTAFGILALRAAG